MGHMSKGKLLYLTGETNHLGRFWSVAWCWKVDNSDILLLLCVCRWKVSRQGFANISLSKLQGGACYLLIWRRWCLFTVSRTWCLVTILVTRSPVPCFHGFHALTLLLLSSEAFWWAWHKLCCTTRQKIFDWRSLVFLPLQYVGLQVRMRDQGLRCQLQNIPSWRQFPFNFITAM